MELISVGHGALDRPGLLTLLRDAGIDAVVDIRRYPGSRRNPDVAGEAMAQWLPAAGIHYRWDARLGGRRRLPADTPVLDSWWRVEQFAAYAAHTRTPEFAGGLADLLAQAEQQRTAMMCSEAVWWRCHRRLVADVVVLAHSRPVRYLMHDGRLVGHPPSEGARLQPRGRLVWDG